MQRNLIIAQESWPVVAVESPNCWELLDCTGTAKLALVLVLSDFACWAGEISVNC
jgi:hypothetical protein